MREIDKKNYYAKIHWRCARRGMLELDWLLSRFFETEFVNLSEVDQHLFEKFLETPDSELYAWLLSDIVPENSDHQRLVKMIKVIDKFDLKK